MDMILHAQPVTRKMPPPTCIGHNDWVFYGEQMSDDEETVKAMTSTVQLGAPFSAFELGQHETPRVPLIKTINYMPDLTQHHGHIYFETLHYVFDRDRLVPYRIKIRGGEHDGLRLSHLPGLNAIRENVMGMNEHVIDPRSEIVSDVLLHDEIFRKKRNSPLQDWLVGELLPALDKNNYNQLSLDSGYFNRMTSKYIDIVRMTPNEYDHNHLRYITDTILPPISNDRYLPASIMSSNPNYQSLDKLRSLMVPNTINFNSFTPLDLSNIGRVECNPKSFQDIADLFDKIPLTDFNVDIVLANDGEILLFHEHFSVNRFDSLTDHHRLWVPTELSVRDYFDSYVLNDMVMKFVWYHQSLTDELVEHIGNNVVKIKLIKTITDEAAILLYRADATSDDPPMCGVYFDLAAQSLAPMTIARLPEIN